MIGKYERGEAAPSIDAAKKIADALGASLDSMAGEGVYNGVDKKTLQRFKELEHLEEEKKKIVRPDWYLYPGCEGQKGLCFLISIVLTPFENNKATSYGVALLFSDTCSLLCVTK